jgi:hypothetical protein
MKLRRHRQATVVQQRAQLFLGHARLERQQRAQLRIAILLDDEQQPVIGQELLDFLAEREGAHAHVVHLHAARMQDVERLVHGAIRTADRDDRDVGARILLDDRPRHDTSSRSGTCASAGRARSGTRPNLPV